MTRSSSSESAVRFSITVAVGARAPPSSGSRADAERRGPADVGKNIGCSSTVGAQPAAGDVVGASAADTGPQTMTVVAMVAPAIRPRTAGEWNMVVPPWNRVPGLGNADPSTVDPTP